MGNGFLYAAIVVVWAVVLVPMWLRRHEETAHSRSIERFSHAMRVLARRERRRAHAGQAAEVTPPDSSAPVYVRRHASRARLAARRRRVLFVLLLATLVGVLLNVLGVVGWYAPTVGGVLVAAFLVHLRTQARRMRELDRRRRATEARLRARSQRLDRASPGAVRPVVPNAPAAEPAPTREPESAPAPPETGWQPTPVPLPTYVTKPTAPARVSRSIDLGGEAWVPPRPTAPEEPEAPEPVAEPEPAPVDDVLEEVDPVTQRRAVND